MNSFKLSTVPLVLSLAGGCLDADAVEDDGRDDTFLSPEGKHDASGVTEGSPEARGVLRVANESSRSSLRNTVGLGASASGNIYLHRLGPDETPATADDDTFETLAELDAVPWVGPSSFDKMLAYAVAQGWIEYEDSTALPGPACEGQLTELGRLNLMETKPISRAPSFMTGLAINGSTRKLGPYTSTFWERKCDTVTGCSAWIVPPGSWSPTPPSYGYVSNFMKFRAGSAYLWSSGVTLYVGVFSEFIQSSGTLACAGWVRWCGPAMT
ncbi:MAG: hypothetical protein H0T42_12970 [Deltaproteobacteria bacterium]|nr:hypothetical protein [Deltaproteobacteria bacterium]